jgi:hypothetical protein
LKDFLPLHHFWCNNSPSQFVLFAELLPGALVMWIQKLADGVIEIDTPIGPRYVQPSFLERASLLWTFRNFPSLPQQVLRPREQRLIDRLWSENRFVPMSIDGLSHPVIGRIERRPTPQQPAAAKKPASSVPSSMAEHGREPASA